MYNYNALGINDLLQMRIDMIRKQREGEMLLPVKRTSQMANEAMREAQIDIRDYYSKGEAF